MSATLDNLLTAARLMAELPQTIFGPFSNFRWQLSHFQDLDRAREQYFSEPESAEIFDWVQQYRAAVGSLGMPLPAELTLPNTPYTPEAWRELEERAEAMQGHTEGDYLLDRIDTWLLECYSLKGRCEAVAGDVVLDCGTFSGNTSLYFSQKVGPRGRVYGFEPGPATFARYKENMRGLDNVIPIQAAVSDLSGTVNFDGDHPGGHMSEKGEKRVAALSIDDMARNYRLARVDFIKMDVEGAEKAALLGAKNTIRTFRPKMALSAYHRNEDCISLPDTLEDIAPGAYDFALRHFSDCQWETVLYCIPRAPGEEAKARPEAATAPTTDREDRLLALIRHMVRMHTQNLVLFRAAQGSNLKEVQTMTAHYKELQTMVDHCNKALAMAAETQKTNRDLVIENKTLRAMLEKLSK